MGLCHGTAVAVGANGVLITGPSGSGKSDLAFRLIELGATLISDDQTLLWASGGQLFGRSPRTIAGLLEVRGVGIKKVPHIRLARICLQVALFAPGEIERHPERVETEMEGIRISYLEMTPFDVSTPLKVKAALKKAASI